MVLPSSVVIFSSSGLSLAVLLGAGLDLVHVKLAVSHEQNLGLLGPGAGDQKFVHVLERVQADGVQFLLDLVV